MSVEQQQWVETIKNAARAKPQRIPPPPVGCVRGMCHKLVTSKAFDAGITAVILANVTVMSTDYWGIEADTSGFQFYQTALLTFNYVYYSECVLKLSGLGASVYFADPWCRFDFFLVSTALLDQFAAEVLENIIPIPPMLLRVLRVLRILRILRLLKGAKDLRNLVVTMVLSFPSLLNVGSVLGLVTFIYAVLGVNFFTYLAHQENITSDRNFESIGSAMLVLFQCLTGDGWSGLMTDAMVDESSGRCVYADGTCGPGSTAVPYFISFQILGGFVFLNLVLAVILENFSYVAPYSSACSCHSFPGHLCALL